MASRRCCCTDGLSRRRCRPRHSLCRCGSARSRYQRGYPGCNKMACPSVVCSKWCRRTRSRNRCHTSCSWAHSDGHRAGHAVTTATERSDFAVCVVAALDADLAVCGRTVERPAGHFGAVGATDAALPQRSSVLQSGILSIQRPFSRSHLPAPQSVSVRHCEQLRTSGLLGSVGMQN